MLWLQKTYKSKLKTLGKYANFQINIGNISLNSFYLST